MAIGTQDWRSARSICCSIIDQPRALYLFTYLQYRGILSAKYCIGLSKETQIKNIVLKLSNSDVDNTETY